MAELSPERLARLSPEKRALLVARLARDPAAGEPAPALRHDPAGRFDPFPLTDLQQAYWIGRDPSFTLGGVAGHAYYEIDLRGVGVQELAAAWRDVVARHDMLRAVVLPDGRQQVLSSVPQFDISETDFRGVGPDEAQLQLLALRDEMSHQVMPADRWPLFDMRAARLSDEIVRLFVGFDGLFVDGWSMAVLFREWRQFLRGEAIPPPPALAFRDYVLAERAREQSNEHRQAEAYWRNRLQDLPPAPELPLAKSPESVTRPRFVRQLAELDANRWQRVKDRAAKSGLTPTTILVTAYTGALAVWSKAQAFTINVPSFNRLPLHPQVHDLIGEFASFTLLAVSHDRAESFADRARRFQDQMWSDLQHADYGGMKVLRDLARLHGGAATVVMPVVFTAAPEDPRQKGRTLLAEVDRFGQFTFGVNQTPQVWLDNHVFDHEGRLVVQWDSVDELFPTGLSEAILGAFLSQLRRLADDDAAWAELWGETAHRLVPAADLAVEAAAQGTPAPVPELLVQQLFEERAAAQPDRTAVVSDKRTLTYGELLRLARQWARRLRDLGCEPNRPVAVVMEKGWEQVVAAYAALFAGCPYVPIDPTQPRQRLWGILDQAGVNTVLTQTAVESGREWPTGVRRLDVDEDGEIAGLSDGPIDPAQTPDDLAYLLFTSGSTGVPKGAMIAHRGVVNALVQTNQVFGIGPDDTAIGLTALHHDMSLFDVFGVLAAGGAVVLPAAWGARDPAHWSNLLADHGVTVWNSVPAMMEMLLEFAERKPGRPLSKLRLAFLGGDWVPLTTPSRLAPVAPNCRLVSVGGPTETTLWNIWYPVDAIDPAWTSIPYGRPIANTSYYVLNESMGSCPVSVPGEMCCAGIGVATGYWKDDTLTAARFVRHPRTGERLYRTGDLGRRRPDGALEFVGRVDFQVKIHGMRIELGEIEAALIRSPGVRAAVASVVSDPAGKPQLVAHVVSDGTAPAVEELRATLAERLPPHMVPAAYVFLDRLPLTPNGKIDRKALPAPPAPTTAASHLPANGDRPTLAKVLGIVADVLKQPGVDPEATLIGYGATSIDMVRIGNQLEAAFGRRPRMDQLFRLQTASAIAGFYEGKAEQRGADSPLQAVGGSSLQRYLARFPVLSDPAAREAFKDSQPGLRRDEQVANLVPLAKADDNEVRHRRYDERRSYRTFSLKPVPSEAFGRFLSCLVPAVRKGKPKYLYASPGGLYPTQVYVHVKGGRVEGLRAGVYYYHPVNHALALLTPDVEIDRSIHVPYINTPIFDEAAFSIFLVAQLRAIAPSYGELSLHFVTLEAGILAHLLETEALTLGLGLCQIGSVQFEKIRPWFHLDEGHALIHSLVGGRVEGRADGPGGANPLAKVLDRVKQLSADEARQLLQARQSGKMDQ